MMIRRVVVAGVVGVAMVAGAQAAGSDRGAWRAVSQTATAITGDIVIAGEKLAINFTQFTIAEIQPLTAEQAGAVFGGDAAKPGVLYRLSIPASKRFLHKNTLCGSDDTQWMVTMASGKTLEVAFFSGAKMPVWTREAVSNSTDLCGTYSYTR